MAQEVLGTDKDRRDYLVDMVSGNNPTIPVSDLYKSIGSAYKRYGFRVCCLALRDMRDLNTHSLFPRITFLCKSYHEVHVAQRSIEQQRESVQTAKEVQEVERNLSEYKKLVSDPQNGVFSLLCKGQITKAEYVGVKDNPEMCVLLIKKAMKVD